jgi:hypothetical protein
VEKKEGARRRQGNLKSENSKRVMVLEEEAEEHLRHRKKPHVIKAFMDASALFEKRSARTVAAMCVDALGGYHVSLRKRHYFRFVCETVPVSHGGVVLTTPAAAFLPLSGGALATVMEEAGFGREWWCYVQTTRAVDTVQLCRYVQAQRGLASAHGWSAFIDILPDMVRVCYYDPLVQYGTVR